MAKIPYRFYLSEDQMPKQWYNLRADMKEKHVDQIVEGCRKAGWNLDFCDLIFCGGTASLLEEQIKKRFPGAFIPEESNFINRGAVIIEQPLFYRCQTFTSEFGYITYYSKS